MTAAGRASAAQPIDPETDALAHDLNNMLSAILGYGALLLADLPEGSEARDFARRMVTAGEQGRELIPRILALHDRSSRDAAA